jgi:hypothetical protein
VYNVLPVNCNRILAGTPVRRRIAVGIVTGYGLHDLVGRSSSPGSQEFSFHVFQTSSGAHPVSYPMGTGDSFSWGVKRQGRETDHSPPSSVEVKKM